jgi:hypothetical protein
MPRGRKKLFTRLVREIADDVSIRSREDLQREISEDAEVFGETLEGLVSLKESLISQIQSYLPRMDPDSLLFLALKAADITGDYSFLEHWKVIKGDNSGS